MLSLKTVIENLENAIGRSLESFPYAVPFHRGCIFKICDYPEAISRAPWCASHMFTGEPSLRISYEPGVFQHGNKILYLPDHPDAPIILLWPENESGMLFADCRMNLIGPDESREKLIAGYVIDPQFAKLRGRDLELERFCDEWEALPGTYS